MQQFFVEPLEPRCHLAAVLLRDFNPQRSSVDWPQDFAEANGMTFMAASEPKYGYEPWVTDGTPAGTRMLGDLAPGEIGSWPHQFTAFAGATYFSTTGALWKTDGTSKGTTKVISDPRWNLYPPDELTVVGDTLYFRLGTETPLDARSQIWKTDGTSKGTVRVWVSGLEDRVGELTEYSGKLYFVSDAGGHGSELWTSDGTPTGTQRVCDLSDHFRGSKPTGLFSAHGYLWFLANDHTNGIGLWRTDGTAAGTNLVKIVNTNHTPDLWYVDVGNVAQFGRTIVFNYKGRAWVSDGTAVGTFKLKDITTRSHVVVAGSSAYFISVESPKTYRLWRSNGTRSGTTVVARVSPKEGTMAELTAWGRNVAFESANRIWKSDGTPAGTVPLIGATKDNNPNAPERLPGYGFRDIARLRVINNRVLFLADQDAAGDGELWAIEDKVSFAGATFADINQNGRRDAGENGIAGVGVYIDVDADGQRDLGEPYAFSNANGEFSFSVLLPGTYNVYAFTKPPLIGSGAKVTLGVGAARRSFAVTMG